MNPVLLVPKCRMMAVGAKEVLSNSIDLHNYINVWEASTTGLESPKMWQQDW